MLELLINIVMRSLNSYNLLFINLFALPLTIFISYCLNPKWFIDNRGNVDSVVYFLKNLHRKTCCICILYLNRRLFNILKIAKKTERMRNFERIQSNITCSILGIINNLCRQQLSTPWLNCFLTKILIVNYPHFASPVPRIKHLNAVNPPDCRNEAIKYWFVRVAERDEKMFVFGSGVREEGQK